MQQEKQRFTYLWNAFNNNTATEAETRELLSLLGTEEESTIDTLMEEAAHPYLSQSDSPLLPTWESMEQRLLEKEAAKAKSITKKIWFWRSFAAAAIAGIALYLLALSPRNITLTAEDTDRNIALNDGTTVILQKGSSLRYSASFGKQQRSILLTGQAWFNVASNPSKPFIVQTSNVSTTVLGTSFSITALPNSGQVSVNVTSGKVKVERGKRLLQVLAASQGLQASIEGSEYTAYNTTPEESTRWMQSALRFNNVSFKHITDQLASRFNVSIQFATPDLGSLTVSSQLSPNATLPQMLDYLCLATGTTYHINDKQVAISKK